MALVSCPVTTAPVEWRSKKVDLCIFVFSSTPGSLMLPATLRSPPTPNDHFFAFLRSGNIVVQARVLNFVRGEAAMGEPRATLTMLLTIKITKYGVFKKICQNQPKLTILTLGGNRHCPLDGARRF